MNSEAVVRVPQKEIYLHVDLLSTSLLSLCMCIVVAVVVVGIVVVHLVK